VSPVVALSLVSCSICAMVALIAVRVGSLPGWRAQRWLAAVAGGVAAYAALNVPLSASPDGPLGWAIPWSPWICRVQLVLVAATLWGWSRYADAYARAPAQRVERTALWLAAALAAASLVPGLAFRDEVLVETHGGLTYHMPATGPLGGAIAGLLLACYLPFAARFVAVWRSGQADGALHAGAFIATLVLGANDAMVTMGWLDTPYLLDLGVALPVAAVGLATALRLVREAGELARLRARLEAQVEERSRALARSHEALHRAEKLAAVGELAAGVAHEVNSPATAAAINIQYLVGHLRAGPPPADALESAEDALSALRRIGEITRRLTGAARLATAGVEAHDVVIRAAVQESLRLARGRCPDHVKVVAGPLDGLAVRGDEGLLVQVLVNLVVNGAQAIPPARPGRVVVGAERRGDRVAITVEDDGDGMPPEVLARVFEPFFTTKPVGVGTGLGLSISRGLLASVGGDLRLASTPGQGTCATLDLPAAAVPAP